MSPSTMRKVLSGVVAATPKCCPEMYPHLAEIAKHAKVSRSTTYRYLKIARQWEWVETSVIMRGKKPATAYIVSQYGYEFLAKWLEMGFRDDVQEKEYNEALSW